MKCIIAKQTIENVTCHVNLTLTSKRHIWKLLWSSSTGNCEEELPKKPVGQLSVNCRPTVGPQSADSWLSVGRQLANCWSFVGRQLANRWPTGFARNIGYLSANSQPTVGNVVNSQCGQQFLSFAQTIQHSF